MIEEASGDAQEGLRGWQLALWNHVEAQVTFGDTKAGLLLTADAILLTGLGLALDEEDLAGGSKFLASASALFLLFGVLAVLIAILPARRHFFGPRLEGNHFLFSWISREFRTADDYCASVRQQPSNVLEAEILRAVFGKSKWAHWKFKWLFISVSLTMAAVMAAFLAATVEVLAG